MNKKQKFLLLLLANLCPAILGVLCFRGGYLSDALVILLSPVVIVLNYNMTSEIRKMMLWNALFLVMSGAGILFSGLLYQWKVAADAEGVMVIQLFFCIWLVICLITILGMLTWAFHVQKKQKQESLAAGVLALSIVAVALYGYMAIVPAVYEGNNIWYYTCGEYVQNGDYEGWIHEDIDNVIIRDRKNGEKKRISRDKTGIYPDQIALGDTCFYVLGGKDYEDSDIIVKLSYEGELLEERKVGYVNLLTLRNGILFLGTKDGEEIPDVPGQFYANAYIPEADFSQGELKECRADKEGICQVGDIKLYDHGIYFSPNPPLESYEGEKFYQVWQGETLAKEDRTRWTELVEGLLAQKGLAEYTHSVDEYQNGTYLYGVVNVWHSVLGFKDKKLKESMAYRIDTGTGEIRVLAEKENVFLIIASENSIVYQEKDQLMGQILTTGDTKVLAKLTEKSRNEFMLSGDYIQVENIDLEKETAENIWVPWKVEQ